MRPVKAEVCVIGGGAAGMMAAVSAAERGRSVILIEGQKFCGKKLRITGKGRCNLTNACDVRTFMQNVPRNGKFLYSSLNAFPPQAAMDFFEQLGVKLKVERGGRVFPVSDNAHDVAKALERRMRDDKVRILNGLAKRILTENGAVSGVERTAGTVSCRSVILATGGMSYPLTGSTGDGYAMAKSLGHSVTELAGSLVPLESEDPCCAQMQGFSLKNVTLSVFDPAGKRIFSDLGEMMFTHFGVTGPLVLSASAHMRDMDCGKYRLEIDLKPGLDEKKLDARILRDFEKYRNRDFGNALDDLAARSMIPVIVERSGIPGDTKVNSVSREQRLGLVELLKHFSLTVSGKRPVSEAIVTSGGVEIREIDPRSMQSKLVPGLYFAGEIIDVDAYTGGFNLQIAWATGRLAGQNA